MTVNIPLGNEDRATEGNRSRRATGELVKRIVLVPINVFRPNRQVVNDQLLVNGAPARWTVFDRPRSERCRLAVETAETALNQARSEQSAAYSLVSEVFPVIEQKVERAMALLGAVAAAVAGLAVGIIGAIGANQPDSVLLEHAMKSVRPGETLPTATDERTFLLGLIGVGVVLLIVGVFKVMEWQQRRSTSPK